MIEKFRTLARSTKELGGVEVVLVLSEQKFHEVKSSMDDDLKDAAEGHLPESKDVTSDQIMHFRTMGVSITVMTSQAVSLIKAND